MRPSLFALLVFILIAASIAPAQKKNRQASTASQKSTIKFLTSPFNPEITSLPPKFKGHNADLIFNVLYAQDIQAEKGEFETTAEWKQRKEIIYGRPLVGTTDDRSILAFQLPISATYAADEQAMLYKIEIDSGGRLLWKQDVFYQPSYIGSNVFGLTRRIQPILYSQTTIVADNYQRTWGHFKMEREDAIQRKFSLQALLVCKLVEPHWKRENEDVQKPTIEKPVEIKIARTTLFVTALQVWIFDYLTGHIYMKQTIQ